MVPHCEGVPGLGGRGGWGGGGAEAPDAKEACGCTMPCSSMMAHSGHNDLPHLHRTWVCIATAFCLSLTWPNLVDADGMR
jgi:hypothetical protein